MSTSSEASRKRTRTRGPEARSVCRAAGSSSRYSRRGPVPTTSATRSVVEPGARTSSATLAMRAGGRLSMTNHPRSSKVLAALDRPAPDSPVISRNSVVIAGSRLPTGLPRLEEQQAGDRRRLRVLLGLGQETRCRRGLLHALDDEPAGDHGVDVAGQRTVDEGDVDVLLHFLERLVLDQIGTDPPVLLVE